MEVKYTIKVLKNSDAAGPDDLTTRSIKKLRPILCNQHHSITNKCFRKKYFPRSWKVTK